MPRLFASTESPRRSAPRVAWLGVVGLVCLAGTAHAEVVEGMLPGGAVLGWPRVKIAPGFSPDAAITEPADSEEFRQHLNLAACTCSKVNKDVDTDIYFELTLSNVTNENLPAEVLVGSECNNDDLFMTNCRVLDGRGVADIDTIPVMETFISASLFDLINARPAQVDMPCNEANGGSAFIWVAVDTDQNGDRDYFDSQGIDLDAFTDVVGYDTKPPPLPDNIRATGGEGSIQLSWDIPTANATDLYAFQAFCTDASGNAVSEGATPLYSTTESICGIAMPQDLVATTVDSDEGTAVATAPTAFSNLDRTFICGTQESGTATSMTISGLENNQEYTVALVAVDFYGNPTGTFLNRTITPRPVIDLWEDIHDRGGKIEGGFCSTGGGDALPGLLVPLAMVWLLRRRKKLVSSSSSRQRLAVLVVLLAPAVARADDYTPYWEDPSSSRSEDHDPFDDQVKWRAGIKLGPYTPAIDDQLGTNMTTGVGPYAAMFGNFYTDDNADGVPEGHDRHVYQYLPTLDVERVIWSGSGQVLLGGSLGYMQKKGFAYQDGSSANEVFRLRSRASSNTFRLIPFALTASYRLTQLDDLWGIPVVPYLRGGLAYYVWWMKGPSGNLSKICTDGTEDSDCDSNKAYGGSLGFQGSLGMSIRAERIDKDASRSMKQSGIYHAGFYVEVMAAIVNGFGSDTKLSVGDKTWFAGFDFEF